ncbi:MAG: hypothetical protein E7675_07450 [Ruminococcaceae bacterium]|nr:hypothetical protein [Oscillospiraceae bacterium]
MRVMIVDIGSNTVKYDAFDIDGDNFVKIEHRATILGFISYIDKDGVPSAEGVLKLCAILDEYKRRSEELMCDSILVFATASLRRCRDPHSVIEDIYNTTGLETVLFDGETEAEMSLLGVLVTDDKTGCGIMADMGGGSTELNVYKDRKSVYMISNPFGALSLKNDFVKKKSGELGSYADISEIERIYDYAKETVIGAGVPMPVGDQMFIVGGSARAIGALVVQEGLSGDEFSPQALEGLICKYSEMTMEKAELLKRLVPGRELIIIPAITAFKAIADVLKIKTIKVATGGIREGYMYYKYIGKET